MASSGCLQAAVLLLTVQFLCLGAADQDTGTVIPAESRPCVDCHAFEFMQRALQDLKKTAFNLDARGLQHGKEKTCQTLLSTPAGGALSKGMPPAVSQ
ncbi:Neuropeptide-like protein C4orf48 -like protein Precursor [Channa argus]|uniref:NELL2-interacting cell ontogeny regulator 1 n=1 Tax=Channa argus TaxID=215402 RepID=A0A6G1Q5P8_CHAAH|nr:Neuropeptide-like protein C4orf48 -like protein Precursor [Channa argus]